VPCRCYGANEFARMTPSSPYNSLPEPPYSESSGLVESRQGRRHSTRFATLLDVLLEEAFASESLNTDDTRSTCAMRVASSAIKADSEPTWAMTALFSIGRQHSQLDRFDFGHKSARLVAQERRHDLEHCVAEAAHVQDVGAFRRSRRAVRLCSATAVGFVSCIKCSTKCWAEPRPG
jgi:hypothetical protein